MDGTYLIVLCLEFQLTHVGDVIVILLPPRWLLRSFLLHVGDVLSALGACMGVAVRRDPAVLFTG